MSTLFARNRSAEPLLSCKSCQRCGGSGWMPVWLVVLVVCFSVTLRKSASSGGIQGERFGSELDAPPSHAPRVAICFYGLAGSLRWTLPSVRKRVLDVLKEGGVRVDVFVHTYDTLEGGGDLDRPQLSKHSGKYMDELEKGLHPTRILMTSQEALDLSWPDPIGLTHYRWNYPDKVAPDVVRNVFRGYWSMATVWSLAELFALEEGFQYDAVVVARPDTWFHADSDLPRRSLPLPEGTAFLPSFDSDGADGGRENDLFAYGSPRVMKILMNRISTFLDIDAGGDIAGGGLDSGGLLGNHLKANNISVSALDFPLWRVRTSGEIPGPDRPRAQEACDSGGDPIACEMARVGFKFPMQDGSPG